MVFVLMKIVLIFKSSNSIDFKCCKFKTNQLFVKNVKYSMGSLICSFGYKKIEYTVISI